jgi:hypothetical protein
MGLTIHYHLKNAGQENVARSLIWQLHQTAEDLPFKEVRDVVDLKGEERKYDKRDREDPLRWLLIQAEGPLKLDEHSWLNVPPKRYGVRHLPELFKHLNPMPFEAGVVMEKDLAEDLRRAGYTVLGGH